MPELQVLLANANELKRPLSIPLSNLRLEYDTGKISAEKFLADYPKAQSEPCLLLQGHPNGWDDASFAAFVTIATRLAADGRRFITPFDYFQLVAGSIGGK